MGVWTLLWRPTEARRHPLCKGLTIYSICDPGDHSSLLSDAVRCGAFGEHCLPTMVHPPPCTTCQNGIISVESAEIICTVSTITSSAIIWSNISWWCNIGCSPSTHSTTDLGRIPHPAPQVTIRNLSMVMQNYLIKVQKQVRIDGSADATNHWPVPDGDCKA
jgi:hypothetical protein